MRRRPDSTAHLAATNKVVRGGRGLSYPTAPAGAIVTSVAPTDIGFAPRREADSFRLPQRALTAAARVLSGEGLEGTRVRIPTESWQSDVWDLRHEVGELRFVGDRQASAVSGCRLYIGAKPEPGAEPAPVTDGPLADLSEAMFGDAAANQQALNRAAKHLVYNGETEIVVTDTGDRRTWYPWAPQEITGSADMGWKVNDGMDTRPLEDTELLIRCWSPAPERQQYADAPTQSILPVARELVGLTKYVSAQIDSRLAGAGLLLVPQGIVPMAGQGYDADTSFAQALMSAMVTAVRDRESAASLVPVIAEIDPTLVDKVQHLKFDSVLDPKAHELRDEAIRRIGLGMDSDPSILLGMGTNSHWTAWAIDENEVRLAVAPIVATVCHALTSGWLRPYLAAAGIPDAHTYQVWFDATPLEIRPDRSKDAQALFDKGAIKDATLRRENGFGDDDAPAPDERKRALLERLVVGAPTLAPALLPLLGIEVPQQALEQAADIVSATGGEDPNAPAGGGSGSSPEGSGDSPGGVVAGPPATLDDGPPQ